MSTIVTRSGKGSPLTHAEVDSNFTNLNTDKLELSGGTMTGDVGHGDNVKATFGASADLQVFHDSANSIIRDVGTGDLQISASNNITFYNDDFSKVYANFTDTSSTLNHDGSLKLATTSSGIDVTGTVEADGLILDHFAPQILLLENDTTNLDSRIQQNGGLFKIQNVDDSGSFLKNRIILDQATGDISFYEDTGTTAKLMWDASDEALEFGDNVKATFGASADLQIYHDGSNSVIEDVGSGVLYMRSNGDGIGMYDSENDVMLFARKDAEVGLYHNGNLKLFTTSSGAYVYDQLEVKANTGYGRMEVGGPDGAYLDLKSPFSDDHDGRIITTGSGLAITGGPSTGVALQYSGSSKVSTTANGIQVTGSVQFSNWTITESGGSLYFATGGTNKMKLDASGNLDVVGSVNSNATIT